MQSVVASWISFCRIGNVEVALDLKRGRYFSVPAGSFSTAVLGLKGGNLSPSLAVRMLIERGAVRPAGYHHAAGDRECKHPAPTSTFAYDRLAKGARLTGIASAAMALVTATACLKLRPLASLLASSASSPSPVARHEPTSGQILQTFRAARMLFPGNESCLRDSLALRSLLAKAGRSTTLVIGVSLSPFLAHCWLEIEGSVVGDNHERVAQFKPILAVH